MSLKILLPYRVFQQSAEVSRIVMQTSAGAYGLLPQRLDCVAALVPGIFSYEDPEGMHYLALDEGIMVKAGKEVLVSVRNAIGGADLGKLHQAVKKEFQVIDENERNMRIAMSKMEIGFLSKLEKFRKGV